MNPHQPHDYWPCLRTHSVATCNLVQFGASQIQVFSFTSRTVKVGLTSPFFNSPRAPQPTTEESTPRPMQLVKTLAIVTVATMMCFAPTAAINSIDVKENTPEERKLYYVRTPITKSPYNRVIPPPPPIQH
ncbi:hypothetical protein ON010_g9357 [Phytophthora cinnamomi]|nr:hypothetical protein ON010_g9357 [Phytophthora cinnamomi]